MWLLQGRPAGKIATAMRRSVRAAKLSESGIAAVLDAADYLQNYAPYILYGAALDWGLPIAMGVIEGACRYLVKDRMNRGGARLTLDGAEAVLRLRALRASGDFDAYWHMHLREDLNRNHARRYAHASLPDPSRHCEGSNDPKKKPSMGAGPIPFAPERLPALPMSIALAGDFAQTKRAYSRAQKRASNSSLVICTSPLGVFLTYAAGLAGSFCWRTVVVAISVRASGCCSNHSW